MLISIPSSFSNKLTWYCNHKSPFGTRKTLRSMVYSIWWSDCWFQSIWTNMFVIIPVIWLNINLKQVFEIIWTCLKPRESQQILMYWWLFLYVSFRENFPIISEKKHIERWAPIAKPSLQWPTWGTWASSVNYALVWAVVIAPSSLVTDYLISNGALWGM